MSGGSASEIWSLRSGDRISRDCEIVANWEGPALVRMHALWQLWSEARQQ